MMLVFFISVVVTCALICHSFFLIFYLYQTTKPVSRQAVRNYDFLFTCIAITLQVGNLLSIFFLFSLFSPFQTEILPCICYNIRAVNVQFQCSCALIISLTRFAKMFFSKRFSSVNQFILGHVIKVVIFLIPAHTHFVMLNLCGMDAFCSKDFKEAYNLLTYSETSKYQQQIITLILQNVDCRVDIMKIFFPIHILPILLSSLFIILKSSPTKYFFIVINPFALQPQSSNQALEMEEFSAQEDSPSLSPTQEEGTSLGILAGLVTVLVVICNQIFLAISICLKSNYLYFIFTDLFISAAIPVCWCVANPKVFTLGFRRFKEIFCMQLCH